MEPTKGINTEGEKKSIYFDGTPTFKPRKITGTKARGTTGTPAPTPGVVIPTPSNLDVVAAKEDYLSIKPKFDAVAALLDKKGQTLTICQNLPASIRDRFLRNKRSDESCWAFYKRMVDLAYEFPAFDPDNPPSLAEAMAPNNDVIDDPFTFSTIGSPVTGSSTYSGLSGEKRVNNYNEDPGKGALLLMLFLAILRLITSAIFTVAYTPMKLLLGKINELFRSKEEKKTGLVGSIPGIGSAIAGAVTFVESALDALGAALGELAVIAFFNTAKDIALDWAEQNIAGGPKLKRDVERFDSLIVSNYVRSIAYKSTDEDWPEAAMLYPHYRALSKQTAAGADVFDYFIKDALSSTRNAANFVGSVADTASKIPADLVGILTLQKNFANSSLDRMAAILGNGFTDDLFCCLIRLVGSMDLRWLKTAQAILRLTMNRQAIVFETLDSALSNLWQTIEKVILSTILGILYNLFDEINARIKGTLTLQANSDLFQRAECVSWNLFVGNMLQFIEGIELSILDLVVDLNNSFNGQDQYQIEYTANLHNNIYAKRLLKLIDIIIRAKQFGELCRSGSVPTDEELRNIFEQVRTTFSVTGEATGVVNNDSIGGASGTNNVGAITSNSTQSANIDLRRLQFSECLKKVPQEKVEEVLNWIRNLSGQA